MDTQQLLDQHLVWMTADRRLIPFVEMDATHRRDTLAMLRRRAAYIMGGYIWCQQRSEHYHPLSLVGELTDEASEWLERRPLVTELARLVAIDDREAAHGAAIDAEIVSVVEG
jgi:hypothetical protein